ncbi:MAG TPA: antibiotic biosynthesis monooxygenase [Candidatus Methylomirabilis sp.]|nr:antibiotic biosynthesis monooxygenase [Candidatus Methylomirabilis sp.]
MVLASLRVVVSPSKRKEVAQALRSLCGPTEARAGCLGCHVYHADEDENAFLLLQEWATDEALDSYLQSDLYRTILAVMETAIAPPEIRFDTLAHTGGVEVVEAARTRRPRSR